MRTEEQIKRIAAKEAWEKKRAAQIRKALAETRRVILHNGCGINIAKGFVDHYCSLGLLEDCELNGLGMYRLRSDLKAKEDLTNGGLLFRRIQPDNDEIAPVGSYWHQVLKSEAFLLIEDGSSGTEGWNFYEELQAAWRGLHGLQAERSHKPWRKAREVLSGIM